ncbi:hypothetical protein SDC9_190007 [bioreactor metagenome]|uniref:Uncharacterized protein n=1 Tax=bioreactor metagenome TaxID=1076179 RepID=A0A645HUB2_9ZZZZ
MLLGGDTGSIVRHVDPDLTVIACQRHHNMAAAFGHELGRIGQQIDHDLQQTVVIRPQHRHLLRQAGLDHRSAVAEQLRRGINGMIDQLPHVHVRIMPFSVPRLDLGQVQHLIDQTRQTLGLGDDDAQEALARRQLDPGILQHHFRKRPDRSQRRAQLMRDR